MEGCFSGLYVTEGHNHEEWKAEKEAQNAAYKACWERREKNEKATAPSSQPNKLTLSSMLKSTLITKFGVSDADVSKLIKGPMKELNELGRFGYD